MASAQPSVTDSLEPWLTEIAAADAAAFARWLAGAEARLRDSLRSFATRVDTEAVLQESLLRVWQAAPRLVPDGRPEPLLRFAIRIARNLAVSELRRNRLDPVEIEELDRLASEDAANLPGTKVPDHRVRQAIEECLAQLPARPAAALTARLENDGEEPDAHLAERLRMRTNTFLKNFGRARRQMTECLRRRGIDIRLEMS